MNEPEQLRSPGELHACCKGISFNEQDLYTTSAPPQDYTLLEIVMSARAYVTPIDDSMGV